jgi:hypothetical protein
MKLRRLTAAVVLLACSGCGSGDTSGPEPITYPVTYDLTGMRPPYAPGFEFITQDNCGRILRSAVDSATLQFTSATGWTMRMRAHKDTPSSTFTCAPLVTVSANSDQSGLYALSESGSSRSIRLFLADDTMATSSVSGTSGLPRSLTLNMPRRRFGSAPAFDYMDISTWTKR